MRPIPRIIATDNVRLVVASLALGVLLGAAGAFVVVGDGLERVSRQRDLLASELKQAEARISSLSESLKQRQLNRVEDIDVRVDSDVDKRVAEALEEAVLRFLSVSLGKDSREMDPELIAGIITGRKITVSGTTYILTAEKVYLSSTRLSVWIGVNRFVQER